MWFCEGCCPQKVSANTALVDGKCRHKQKLPEGNVPHHGCPDFFICARDYVVTAACAARRHGTPETSFSIAF